MIKTSTTNGPPVLGRGREEPDELLAELWGELLALDVVAGEDVPCAAEGVEAVLAEAA